MTDYRIPVAEGVPRDLARAWLTLGVAALIGSGLLALLLVLSRTPGMQHVFPLRDFFRSALVVHVDLSVLVWFMAFAAVLWSVAGDGRHAALGRTGFRLAATGTGVLTLSPFFPDAQPLLNNYIPVLQQPVFFAGLLICGAGFGLALVRALLTIPWKVGQPSPSIPLPEREREADSPSLPARERGWEGGSDGTAVLRFGALLGAIAGTLAFAGFVLSWVQAPAAEGQSYYEVVFWGGGHVLQFQHALLLVVAWFWLASELGHGPRIPPRTTAWLFAVAALPLLAVPAIYAATPVGSGWHMAWFARLMEAGHPFMTPLILVAAVSLWRARSIAAPAKSAFAASFLLFAVGGVLAFLIKGVNVVIPAHYHGSIVGVTLAFMGLAYVLLPQLGFGSAAGRMARWQPYVYGGGQLIHILGLAWSGGYGVQRKVAGAEQVLTTLPQKIGMGMMGAGGLIAIIGGVMFVLVCLKAMRAKPVVSGTP